MAVARKPNGCVSPCCATRGNEYLTSELGAPRRTWRFSAIIKRPKTQVIKLNVSRSMYLYLSSVLRPVLQNDNILEKRANVPKVK